MPASCSHILLTGWQLRTCIFSPTARRVSAALLPTLIPKTLAPKLSLRACILSPTAPRASAAPMRVPSSSSSRPLMVRPGRRAAPPCCNPRPCTSAATQV